MSVYTRVSRAELETFLQDYAVGDLLEFEGITAGIENTNYFVSTTQGEYVLTLFEQHSEDELGWFLDLMHHLSVKGVPSADPVAGQDGKFLRWLCGKPAALVHRLRGGHPEDPSPVQCAAIGRALADLHLAGASFLSERSEDRGLPWMVETLGQFDERLPDESKALIAAQVAEQEAANLGELPRGIIHADLFHDNAMFDGDQVTGLIDFYYACTGYWLYDLAVVANDWCTDKAGLIQAEHMAALLEGYRSQRPFEPAEEACWDLMLRRAALRFWLSRLKDKLFPRDGDLVLIKDPQAFERILRGHLANPQTLS